MPFATLPAYTQIGVAVTATITAYNAGTGDFSFTVAGVTYHANWPTDVIANAINTVARVVGASGRLNLHAAKATTLGLHRSQSVGSNYNGTDYNSYTRYTATVRTVAGNNVTLNIGGANHTVDWSNPAHVWTGSETAITPNVGSAGDVRLGDAYGASQGILAGGADKWPTNLRRRAADEVRVQIVGEAFEVVVLDPTGAPVLDDAGRTMKWSLPHGHAGLFGFDPTDQNPQTIAVSHVLKARLAMP